MQKIRTDRPSEKQGAQVFLNFIQAYIVFRNTVPPHLAEYLGTFFLRQTVQVYIVGFVLLI